MPGFRTTPRGEYHRRGPLVAAFVVLTGVGVSLLEADEPGLGFVLVALGLAAVYTALFLVTGDRRMSALSGAARAVYFAVQLALVGGLSALFASRGIFAVEWVITMPLIAQSRMHLRPWGTTLVSLASLAVMTAHVQHLVGWRQVPGAVFGISTAVVFVLLFTDIAMREAAARDESQRLSDELADANRQLADYAVQAEELATVRERGRLAQDIHDGLGHYLSALNMQLEAARAVFDRDRETSRDALDKAQGLARTGLSEIRRAVAALTTSPLDGRPLDDALARLVEQNAEAGIATRLEILGASRPLGARAGLTLYRAVQEGLTNARKHSRARRVDVVLDYRSPEQFRLQVRDDGVGSDDPRGGFGLLGVRERVRQVAGRFDVSSRSGHGLTLEVEIPA